MNIGEQIVLTARNVGLQPNTDTFITFDEGTCAVVPEDATYIAEARAWWPSTTKGGVYIEVADYATRDPFNDPDHSDENAIDVAPGETFHKADFVCRLAAGRFVAVDVTHHSEGPVNAEAIRLTLTKING